VNFAGSLLCGVNYARLPRQVQVDKKSLFNTIIQQSDKTGTTITTTTIT